MKNYKIFTVFLFLSLLIFGCKQDSTKKRVKTINKKVSAKLETAHLNYDFSDDSVDDIAIWVNKNNSTKSLVIGTDKKKGMAVYDLSGKMLNFYELGACNNVDVRYNFVLGTDTVDVVGVTNRKKNSIQLFKIDSTKQGIEFIGEKVMGADFGDVYGFSLYHNPTTNNFSAFVNTKLGVVEQWTFSSDSTGKIVFAKASRTKKNGVVEGMVADDANGYLYIAEEDYGVWRHSFRNDTMVVDGHLIEGSKVSSNVNIVDDIEGLTIYKANDKKGYLLISSQGNSTYAIFNRMPPNKYLGSFYIEDGSVDGTEETDGIDVCNLPLNENFKEGIFIVQDGLNHDGNKDVAQDFKYISWGDIARQFNPNLTINTDLNQ